MGVVLYRSTDPGAIQLDGLVGSLVGVLDVVLPAAGWSIAFTGTNIRAYRQPAALDSPLTLRAYLRVNDAGPGAGGAREARIVGYETMSDVNTGINPCPTVAQLANGLFVRKSAAADANTRTWMILADARTFYMWILSGDVASTYLCWMFGDYYSFMPSDFYRVMVMGRVVENSAVTGAIDGVGNEVDLGNVVGKEGFSSNMSGHFMFRDASHAAGAIAAGKVGDRSINPTLIGDGGASIAGFGNLAYKNPADSNIYTPPIFVTHSQGGATIRGLWRGQYHFGHAISAVSDGETFPGTLDLNGKTFRVIKQSGNLGIWVAETSNTWITN